MFSRLDKDDGWDKRPKKTIKPILKFNAKDVKMLIKKKPPGRTKADDVSAAVQGQRRRQPSDVKSISIAAESKIKNFCDTIQAGELERVRLTEYIEKLDPRCTGLELNAWSTSQLLTSNVVRTTAPSLSREVKITRGKKKIASSEVERSTLYWTMSIVLDTGGSKKNTNSKKKDTVTVPTPTVPNGLSERRLLAEYTIFRLWLIVRYVFTTVRTAAAENPSIMAPIIIVKSDGNSALGKTIREELSNSYRREVKDLKTVYRLSFVWN